MLKTFSDFERRPDLLAKFDALLPRYSIACIFADVMYRQNVMTSAIKPAFKAKATGQAVTVHGWIYGLHDGLLSDLKTTIDCQDDVLTSYEAAIATLPGTT